MSSSEEDEPQLKRRRGVVHEENYQRNKIRIAGVKGEAYKNYNNKQNSSKIKPQGMLCKCNFRCSSIVNKLVIDQTWDFFLFARK